MASDEDADLKLAIQLSLLDMEKKTKIKDSKEMPGYGLTANIAKVYPDYQEYGQLLDSMERFNEIIPELGTQTGGCKLSGSIADGSYALNSRKKAFDIDFTWAVNKTPLKSPNLEYYREKGNYVLLKYEEKDDKYSEFKDMRRILKKTGQKFVSPEKFKEMHPVAFDRIMKQVLWQEKVPKFLHRTLGIVSLISPLKADDMSRVDSSWYNTVQKVITADITPVLKCQDKNILRKFISRPRENKWPPETLLRKIEKQDFFLVPKSVASEKTYGSYTWRLSFANAEELLFQSMTPFARRVYTLLKAICHNIDIMNVRADIVTTYHLKNVLFWALENNADIWKDEEAIGIPIYALLENIKQFVELKELPFYFDTDVSLIKDISRDAQQTIIQNIDDYLGTGKLRGKPAFPFLDASMVVTEETSMILERYPAQVTNTFFNSVVDFLIFVHDNPKIMTDLEKVSNAFIKKIYEHIWKCQKSGRFSKLQEEDFRAIIDSQSVPDKVFVKQMPKSYVEAVRDAIAIVILAVRPEHVPFAAIQRVGKANIPLISEAIKLGHENTASALPEAAGMLKEVYKQTLPPEMAEEITEFLDLF